MVCKPCADFTLGLNPGQVSLSFSPSLSTSPRTPQTPLKHYPRADALGKSDATIQLPRRIDITSHDGRPLVQLYTYVYIYIHIHTHTYKLSNLHSVAEHTRDRPGRQAFEFSKRVESRPRKHRGMYVR